MTVLLNQNINKKIDLDNSVLLINKQTGLTSSQTVNRLKRILNIRKIGHSGTLDKFASGLLVVCTGKATKLTRIFLESDKRYVGTVKLGAETDTCDSEGSIIEERSTENLDADSIYKLAEIFSGQITQVPPVYSSLKVGGKRASDLAREGKKVILKERSVDIKDIRIYDIDIASSTFTIDIRCSKGTYIRSIARDMGKILGTGAYLESLIRIESGHFSLTDASSIHEVEKIMYSDEAEKKFIMHPVDALRDFGRITVNDTARKKILNGGIFDKTDIIEITENGEKKYIMTDTDKNLIALGSIDIENWNIRYDNVFNQ